MARIPDKHEFFDEATAFISRPGLWFFAAIVFVAIALLIVICGLLAIASLPADRWKDAFDILYKAALIAAGFVTFCTVAWRGLLSSRQVNVQQAQVDRLTRQIELTEENNLAELLQKGAELLSDAGKKAHVAAGIATLQAVVTAPNAKFATEAMNLLADYLQTNHATNHMDQMAGAAIDALKAGAALSRLSSRELAFEGSQKELNWRCVVGVKAVKYAVGAINYDSFRAVAAKYEPVKYRFDDIDIFLDDDIEVDARFSGCHFANCTIKAVQFRRYGQNSFKKCDFSDAIVTAQGGIPDLREGDNFFSPDRPPRLSAEGKAAVVWTDHLICRERTGADGIPF